MTLNPLVVRQLRSTPVSVPLAHPVRTASGVISHAPLVLLDLASTEGIEGRAYLFAYTPVVLRSLVELLDALAPLIQGTPMAPAALEQLLQARLRLLGTSGLMGMALAGIDMAAWDANARAAGLPLGRLLGGTLNPVPAYFSQGLDGAVRGVELAHQCIEHGYRTMKIKAGYATLAEDIATIQAVQAVLAPAHVALAVDYNQSLSVPEALRRCRALDDLGLAWIEEPTRADDDEGHARIAREALTPIMIGENWDGTRAMARSIAAQACDLAMPDLMKIGGVSGWIRAAGLAAVAGMPMSSHLFPEMSVHLMAVTPTADRLEVLDLAAPVLRSPLRVENGMVTPSAEPGSGLDWDEDAVRRYRLM